MVKNFIFIILFILIIIYLLIIDNILIIKIYKSYLGKMLIIIFISFLTYCNYFSGLIFTIILIMLLSNNNKIECLTNKDEAQKNEIEDNDELRDKKEEIQDDDDVLNIIKKEIKEEDIKNINSISSIDNINSIKPTIEEETKNNDGIDKQSLTENLASINSNTIPVNKKMFSSNKEPIPLLNSNNYYNIQ